LATVVEELAGDDAAPLVGRIAEEGRLASEIAPLRRLPDVLFSGARPGRAQHLIEELAARPAGGGDPQHPEVVVGAPEAPRVDGREVGRQGVADLPPRRQLAGPEIDLEADGPSRMDRGEELGDLLVLVVDRAVELEDVDDE